MDLMKSIWSGPTVGRKRALRGVFVTGVAFALVAGLSAPADASRKSRQWSAEAKKAELWKDFGATPKGPLQIVVSIGSQHVTIYDNGVRVAQGPVATGMRGYETRTGVFSIIQKDRYHRSNLYSNAPMPYMQRITWSGVALHEGPLPGHPASHGCIRLSHDFASRLWLVTKLGTRVIVAHHDVVPIDFTHPHLFVPKPKPLEPQVAGSEAEKPAEISKAIQVAVATTSRSAASPEMVVPTKRTGHVAVFVSRKERKIFVRQGFAPLFDMPVTIDDPDLPLGTHVFTAMEVTNNGTGMRWNVMTIPGEQPRDAGPRGKMKPGTQDGFAPKPVEAKPTTTPAQALDRIHIPQEAIERIGEVLIPGSSLVVSDQGLGPETGRDTDFIVLTPLGSGSARSETDFKSKNPWRFP
jgi:L,D-transpeptidase catalytic domain